VRKRTFRLRASTLREGNVNSPTALILCCGGLLKTKSVGGDGKHEDCGASSLAADHAPGRSSRPRVPNLALLPHGGAGQGKANLDVQSRRRPMRAGSSAEESQTFNPEVVGSNPTRPSRSPAQQPLAADPRSASGRRYRVVGGSDGVRVGVLCPFAPAFYARVASTSKIMGTRLK
jgi:hypothetical protein